MGMSPTPPSQAHTPFPCRFLPWWQRVVSGRCVWEGGGGRWELGVINGTIEWVMPL